MYVYSLSMRCFHSACVLLLTAYSFVIISTYVALLLLLYSYRLTLFCVALSLDQLSLYGRVIPNKHEVLIFLSTDGSPLHVNFSLHVNNIVETDDKQTVSQRPVHVLRTFSDIMTSLWCST